MSDKSIDRWCIAILVIIGLIVVAGLVCALHQGKCIRTAEFNNIGVDGVLTASGSYCAEHEL